MRIRTYNWAAFLVLAACSLPGLLFAEDTPPKDSPTVTAEPAATPPAATAEDETETQSVVANPYYVTVGTFLF
jgi:hypothetical protein